MGNLPKNKTSKMENRKELENIIEITSQYFSSDWVDSRVHKINLDKIMGFELSFRFNDWHIVVVEKTMTINKTYNRYDLSHWVYHSECVKLLNDSRCKIFKIENMHNSPNFVKHLSFLFNCANPVAKTTFI